MGWWRSGGATSGEPSTGVTGASPLTTPRPGDATPRAGRRRGRHPGFERVRRPGGSGGGGEVYIGDERVTDLAPKTRDIAMVFQNYALYPHMGVEQNMNFALRLRHIPKEDSAEKARETAELPGLAGLLDRKPVPLSGGDRIAVLDKGRLQQVGSPEELYLEPANRFVAGFMGSPSMNFATVELRGDAERMTITLGGREFELPDAVRRRPALAERLGPTIVLGLRPAAFSLATAADTPSITVVPLGVESLGDEKHVLFDAPSCGEAVADVRGVDDVPVAVDESAATQLWTGKVTQHADLAIGRPMPLAVDMGAAYFFDPQSGDAIAEVRVAETVSAG